MEKTLFQVDQEFDCLSVNVLFHLFRCPCPVQPILRRMKLKHKFEEFDALNTYLSDIKASIPNLDYLEWNSEFNLGVERVSCLPSFFSSIQ